MNGPVLSYHSAGDLPSEASIEAVPTCRYHAHRCKLLFDVACRVCGYRIVGHENTSLRVETACIGTLDRL